MARIDISNRALLVYGGLFVLFLSVGFVIAFNSGGPPSAVGHDSGEVLINVEGVDKTLQQAYDDGDFDMKTWSNRYCISGSFSGDRTHNAPFEVKFAYAASGLDGWTSSWRQFIVEGVTWSGNEIYVHIEKSGVSNGGCYNVFALG